MSIALECLRIIKERNKACLTEMEARHKREELEDDVMEEYVLSNPEKIGALFVEYYKTKNPTPDQKKLVEKVLQILGVRSSRP